jgi:hypothetical protein
MVGGSRSPRYVNPAFFLLQTLRQMLIWSAIDTWPRRIVPGGTFRMLGAAVKEAYSGSSYWQTDISFHLFGSRSWRRQGRSYAVRLVWMFRRTWSAWEVRSLGHVGTWILGSVAVSNGIKSACSSFVATTSKSVGCNIGEQKLVWKM